MYKLRALPPGRLLCLVALSSSGWLACAPPLASDGGPDLGADGGAGGDGGGPAAPACRLLEIEVFEQPSGVLTSRTRYTWEDDGESYVAEEDQGADRVVDVRFGYERLSDTAGRFTRHVLDGSEPIVTDETYSASGQVVVREVSGQGRRERCTYVYASSDRGTARGLFPELGECDQAIDGTVNERSRWIFEGGRPARFESDRAPPAYPTGADTTPDGVADIVATYARSGLTVLALSDRGGARCSGGTCTQDAPDGTPDTRLELRFGDAGDPDLLFAGRPLEQRQDVNGDGTWDYVVETDYREDGRWLRQRTDLEGDGVFDQERVPTYECF